MEKVLVTADVGYNAITDDLDDVQINISDTLRPSGSSQFTSFKDLIGFTVIGVEEVDEGFILELE
jgi:hypothetical protein